MGLTLHHGNRLEALAERLASRFATSAGGVLEPEVVLVQHAGMGRWLSLQLAARNGVCAAVRFRTPAAFAWDVLRAVVPDLPAASPWDADVVTWRLMAELARCSGDARFAPVAAYLARGAEGADADLRRHQLATRLAALFDQYGLYRPALLCRWEAGDEPGDWQAELWRRLVAATAQPHRAGLQRQVMQALADAVPDALPRRVSVFGIPALPPYDLDLLSALAVRREVDLFLLNPCQEYAGDVRSPRAVARLARDRDPSALLLEVGNPLLASMGRQPIELLERVLELDGELAPCFAEPDGGHLLAAVQADILHLRSRGPEPKDAPRLPVAADDRSIQLHVCHSPMREVEVLYDQLLALFAEHPGLQPGDVVVMTPEVEPYAPCFEAVRAAAPDGQRIPFTIADVGLRAERPLIEAFLGVLALPEGRFEVDRLLALLAAPPVRRRFGLDESDLEQVGAWVRNAGIRWGLDAEARAGAGLPRTHEHTWRFGLDRLLLGYALPGRDREPFAEVLPFDDVEGSQARALGGLAAFVDAAGRAAGALAAPRPIAAWADDLRALLDTFCDAGDDEDEDAARAVREVLATLVDGAVRAGFTDAVSRPVVAAWLAEALAARTPGGRFLAGAVTVCQLVPMRSVPFEVVCLLGMDVAGFPRSSRAPGFDRMASKRERGDRSRRDDDRTLFLDALLSARSRLHVSWVGRSIRDNAEIPPSVLVSELLDYVDRGFLPPPGARRVRDHLTVEHRLQAFSRRYFDGSDPRLFSHADQLCAAVAGSLRAGGRTSAPLLTGSLPPPPVESPADEANHVRLDALVGFFAHPTRALLRERLGIRVADEHELPEPREPFALDALQRHGLDAALLALRLEKRDLEESTGLLRARGVLPHGALGASVVRERVVHADALAARLGAVLPEAAPAPRSVELRVGGFRLTGTLDGVGPEGRVAWRVGGRRGRDLLALWIRHLALQLVATAAERHSVWIDREGIVRLRPVDDAESHLLRLLELYREGHGRLLRFFPEASLAFASADLQGRDGAAAARDAWNGSDWGPPGEAADRWNRLAWRTVVPLDGEFPGLARAVFTPLLHHAEKAKA